MSKHQRMSLKVLQDPWVYARFSLSYVVDPDTGCWVWQKALTSGHRYPVLCIGGGRQTSAHRYSVARKENRVLHTTELACHRCNNTACVNPQHLYVGTQFDNMADRQRAGGFPKGLDHPHSKLCREEVLAIKNRTDGLSVRKAAKHYGVAKSIIQRIRAGRSYANV